MDDTKLALQAHVAAHTWLAQATRCIDEEFGEGHAAANPALVAGFMQVCAMDSIAASTGERLVASLDAIADALRE